MSDALSKNKDLEDIEDIIVESLDIKEISKILHGVVSKLDKSQAEKVLEVLNSFQFKSLFDLLIILHSVTDNVDILRVIFDYFNSESVNTKALSANLLEVFLNDIVDLFEKQNWEIKKDYLPFLYVLFKLIYKEPKHDLAYFLKGLKYNINKNKESYNYFVNKSEPFIRDFETEINFEISKTELINCIYDAFKKSTDSIDFSLYLTSNISNHLQPDNELKEKFYLSFSCLLFDKKSLPELYDFLKTELDVGSISTAAYKDIEDALGDAVISIENLSMDADVVVEGDRLDNTASEESDIEPDAISGSEDSDESFDGYVESNSNYLSQDFLDIYTVEESVKILAEELIEYGIDDSILEERIKYFLGQFSNPSRGVDDFKKEVIGKALEITRSEYADLLIERLKYGVSDTFGFENYETEYLQAKRLMLLNFDGDVLDLYFEEEDKLQEALVKRRVEKPFAKFYEHMKRPLVRRSSAVASIALAGGVSVFTGTFIPLAASASFLGLKNYFSYKEDLEYQENLYNLDLSNLNFRELDEKLAYFNAKSLKSVSFAEEETVKIKRLRVKRKHLFLNKLEHTYREIAADPSREFNHLSQPEYVDLLLEQNLQDLQLQTEAISSYGKKRSLKNVFTGAVSSVASFFSSFI